MKEEYIRFLVRAWNKETKMMVDLSYITPLALDYSCKQKGIFVPFDENLILMKCSGVKDINGVYIYEGDLVKMMFGNSWIEGEIVFKTGTLYIKPYTDIHQKYDHFDFDDINRLEIVGNIYENSPEKEEIKAEDVEILPCPFCNGVSKLHFSYTTPRWWYVECMECLASSKRSTVEPENKAKLSVIHSWNTRK